MMNLGTNLQKKIAILKIIIFWWKFKTCCRLVTINIFIFDTFVQVPKSCCELVTK